MFSTSLNQLKTLRVRYIVKDSRFKKLTFYLLQYYVDGGYTPLNSTNSISALYGLPTTNIATGTPRAFLITNGWNMTLPADGCFDTSSTGTFITSTTLELTISTSCTSTIQFLSMYYTLAFYNELDASVWPFPAGIMNYTEFYSPPDPSTYTDPYGTMQTFNTFWGITRLSLSTNNVISFTSDMTAKVSIKATRSTYNNMAWVVLIFQFKECDPTTPYYMLS
jgi:hypothetical protein